MNRPKLCVQHKKALWIIELSNELASQFKRSQFCFKLNALVIVEVDIIIDQLPCFSECFDLRSVNTFCFEDREEIFS